MNRERVKELLPVLEAFANGEDIQFRLFEWDLNFENEWSDLSVKEELIITFPADDYDYRIKPKAREFWIHKKSMTAFAKGVISDPPESYIVVREVL